MGVRAWKALHFGNGSLSRDVGSIGKNTNNAMRAKSW